MASPDSSGNRIQNGLRLAVIVPTLNERDNVQTMIAALDSALDGIAWEAVFVDDNSSDGTPELVESIARTRANIRLIRRIGRKGLSAAVIEGFLATVAPVVAVVDADMQHDESKLAEMLRRVEQGGAELVIGTRYAETGGTGDWSQSRERISRFAGWVADRVMPQKLSDPMSGFFMIRRDVFVEIAPNLSALGFKILLDIVLSSARPLTVSEVPYEFRQRHAGESKLDSAVALEFVIQILDRICGRWIPPRLILFGIVGALGLVVHLLVLRTSMGLGFTFGQGQSAAVAIAILFNYVLNNLITYRDIRHKTAGAWFKGLLGFYLVCAAGAVANVGVGVLVFAAEPRWWLAGIAGVIVGSLWNYCASTLLVWRKK
ncbi:putative glycosyltransferase [Caenibius tardaugens NBRC 16725]|uniref:Putative glycosyltransferase n=1 Tax=Caenibius tardaugens NBRC 16725 TaxID=1219035 RepID=U2YHC3_9SPHN|nr:glycosyltransferase family 2 protein [Caenibius tardaugens]AZI37253.1 glycosyltransferase family 2 protein [Caenibius tardaugens NBRC 16725]GAD47500.1 putative glycosyltransferase [Caenibius tardaugens NBRC 16725]